MKKQIGSGRFNRTMTLVAALVLMTAVMSATGVFTFLDWKLMDAAQLIRRAKPVHRDNVVFVCIDQKSIDFFNANMDISWPWPRDYYGRIVQYLTACDARLIVFDVIFSEQDIARDGVMRNQTDREFAEAIAASGRTILAAVGQEDMITGSPVREPGFFIELPPTQHQPANPVSFESAVLPIPSFRPGLLATGLANLEPDGDGIHRRYPYLVRVGDNWGTSLAGASARAFDPSFAIPGDVLDDTGMFHLNWYGRGGTGRLSGNGDAVFKYYSFHAALLSSLQEEMGEMPILSSDTFRDKIVVIGSNAPGLFDLKATPFTHQNLYPGMEIHATAIENMLAGDWLRVTPRWMTALLIAAVAALLYGVTRLTGNLRTLIAAFAAIILLTLAGAYAALVFGNTWIHAADVTVSASIVFAGIIIDGYFRETKEKRVLRSHFGRYVNESVLNDILENPDAVDFEGRTVRASIMATDIQGFTSISEQLTPHEVVSLLNDYLSEVSEALIDNGAYINKYIGDAILALYGAFGEDGHEAISLRAALRARDIIARKIGEAEQAGRIPFITRMGITTGDMTLGNIGSKRKIEYTVIGDTVNTAFRLEGLNKYYGTRIIVSGVTKDGTGDGFEFRLLDSLRVKGKEQPEEVYELLGEEGRVEPEVLRRRDAFEAALRMYRARAFKDAAAAFRSLAEEGDETSASFIQRCETFIAEPPPPDWNGVWVMSRK